MEKVQVLIKYLHNIGYEIESTENKVNDNKQNASSYKYDQIRFKNSEMKINLYETGKILVQGKPNDKEKNFFDNNKMENIEKAIEDYEKMKLNKKVVDLINDGQENEYCDFKEKYNEKKDGSLLKDILSFSNCINHDQSYLIFGVADNGEIKGLSEEEKNKIQLSNINDLLDKVHFAHNKKPILKVEELNYKFNNIKVIVFEKSKNVPFYLEEKYSGVNPFHIYVRHQDKNSLAGFEEVEHLWKYRLGIEE